MNSREQCPGELIIITTAETMQLPGDLYSVTRKLIDGVLMFAKYWDGPVTVMLPLSRRPTENLDSITVGSKHPEYRLEVFPGDSRAFVSRLAKAKAVTAPLGHRFAPLARRCRTAGVPLVYISETTLRTRFQITNAQPIAWIRKLRRSIRETRYEWYNRRAIAMSEGIQCNGLPTFVAYREISPNAMLYFDSRIVADEIISEEKLNDRLDSRPIDSLRLCYAGRLIEIKGARHLIDVAKELDRRGVSFTFDICGAGSLANEMTRRIELLGLSGKVRMRGILDFHSELTPMLQREIDLFVCCHVQGDPSCAYLETMACGVPIVGFDNEAWGGLVHQCDGGWTTPMRDIQTLAAKIEALANDPAEIREKSIHARSFATKHTFERTFAARVDHIKKITTGSSK